MLCASSLQKKFASSLWSGWHKRIISCSKRKQGNGASFEFKFLVGTLVFFLLGKRGVDFLSKSKSTGGYWRINTIAKFPCSLRVVRAVNTRQDRTAASVRSFLLDLFGQLYEHKASSFLYTYTTPDSYGRQLYNFFARRLYFIRHCLFYGRQFIAFPFARFAHFLNEQLGIIILLCVRHA